MSARLWLLRGALAASVFFVYAPVRDFPFVVYDDRALVVDHELVNGGLRPEAVRRAFTESHVGNYVPLTWLSHMLDVELFGLDAGAHHVANALLHLAATLLFLEAFLGLGAGVGAAAFAAAAFGLHPLHVESVAWVAERRDTLSALFFAAALWAYAAHARGGRRASYAALLALSALGMLAKPMLVTLPLVLLLLDRWPLERRAGAGRLALEKLPLVALAGLTALAALWAQRGAGAMVGFDIIPLGTRLATAALGHAAYLRQTFWPGGLAVFYPYDLEPDAGAAWAAGALAAALSLAALLQWRRRPWWSVGWLWWLLMLLPVIGLIQVGNQSRADRYTYLPLLGLALALGAGGARLGAGRPRLRAALVAAALLLCTGWALAARQQVLVWRSSVHLFEQARSVTGRNPIVDRNLGEAWEERGVVRRALRHYRAALRRAPHLADLRVRVGELLATRGEWEEAEREFREALRHRPGVPGARLGLARLALQQGQPGQALALLEAEGRHSDDPEVAFRVGELRAARGEAGAAALLAEALAREPALAGELLLPRDPAVAEAMAAAWAALGRPEEEALWSQRARALEALRR